MAKNTESSQAALTPIVPQVKNQDATNTSESANLTSANIQVAQESSHVKTLEDSKPEPTNGNGNHNKRKSQPTLLKELFDSANDRLTKALPKHITPERWASVILLLNSRNKKLQECTPQSIYAAALASATLGLDLNPTMGEGYLIPRKNKETGLTECTFMPGYKGLRKLVLNSGEVLSVRSDLVYESELECGTRGKFIYEFRPDLAFLHQPCLDSKVRGKIVYAYAIAKMKNGEFVIEVMTIDEVEETAHRRSQAYISAVNRGNKNSEEGPWVTDRAMMIRKTPLKRLAGQLPMSAELVRAIDLDNVHYASSVVDQVNSRGAEGLLKRLEDQAASNDENIDDSLASDESIGD